MLASRADYFENYAGRWISIEARPSDNSPVRANNPVMTAAWDSGPGTPLGGAGQEGILQAFIDTDPPDADYYLYHFNTFRVGALDDGKPMPSQVRVASANGGVDTIGVKRWTSKDGKGFPAQYVKDFTTDYVDPQQAYKKIRDLRTEFSNLADIIDLPNKTAGYQRKAQTVVGLATPYAGATGSLSTALADQTVVITSKAWGHEGGNDITVGLRAGAALGVTVAGKAITVDVTATSTAAQVVDAINASADAAALVTASKYRTNAGAGVVATGAAMALSDNLKAPATYPRGPQTVQMIRIGAHRDGTKTGVLLYCQEHAREWATSLVCLETAERLLRNYGTDPETKQLLDNLDVFIIPVINADGAAYSRYDFTSQRKNMVNYCDRFASNDNDPLRRNTWGVDINRNFSVGSVFDGYVGASATGCTGETFAGPGEFSEPESRNEQWVQSEYPNIKFANNVHSYGGYFTWPPGAYKTVGRETLPYASAGTNQFFDQTAAATLERIQSYRQTTVLPARTGPVADVLYSAAGNSADEAYYTRGIIGYDFEIGVDRFTGAVRPDGTPVVQQQGFTPPYNSEGHDEGQEFANGNIGLLTAALGYEQDTAAPKVAAKVAADPAGGLSLTFDQDEPADIYYTLDGSTPTKASKAYAPAGPRQRVQAVHLDGPVTLKWIAYDIKGQTAGVQTYVWSSAGVPGDVGGSVPATLSLTLGAPANFGAFTPGVERDYDASTTANVISTAGDATLSVSDPGHLANGAFTLPSPLQVSLSKSAWTAPPVANDAVTIAFKQHIGANDALRTGAYSKTLTFTLSTTTP